MRSRLAGPDAQAIASPYVSRQEPFAVPGSTGGHYTVLSHLLPRAAVVGYLIVFIGGSHGNDPWVSGRNLHHRGLITERGAIASCPIAPRTLSRLLIRR